MVLRSKIHVVSDFLSLSFECRILPVITFELCIVRRRSFEKAATGVELLIHSVQQELGGLGVRSRDLGSSPHPLIVNIPNTVPQYSGGNVSQHIGLT